MESLKDYNLTKKRISVHQLEVGMLVAEDVLNPYGVLLIPRDTPIIETHLESLAQYRFCKVIIYEKAVPKTDDFDETVLVQQIQETFLQDEYFKLFTECYEQMTVLARDYLSKIGNGDFVEIDDLFFISDALLSTANSLGDVFNYLHHLKVYDDYTFTHCVNVSMICNIFGRWLKCPEPKLKDLTIAGLLHDIGKTAIDYAILNKPGKLTEAEFNTIKQHPLKGYELVKDMPFSSDLKLGILQHHEKFNGSGYPYGLTNEATSEFAKIISIADIYDALTSNRSYRKKMSPFYVIRMFENDFYNVLDTSLLFAFLANIAQNYLGFNVLLSNNEVGKIIFINRETPSRPIIAVGSKIYNLVFDLSITIVEVL